MERLNGLAANVVFWTLTLGSHWPARIKPIPGEVSVVIEHNSTYRIVEQEDDAVVQCIFASEGDLAVTVHLLGVPASYTWKNRLPASSASALERAIHSAAKHSHAVAPGRFFSVAVLSAEGSKEIASWDKRSETEESAETRRAVEKISHGNYYLALAYLRSGSKAEAKDPASAGEQYKKGIDALGDRYQSPEIVDDTGMKLVLAQSVDAKDGVAKAAPIFQRVLASRLAVYAARERVPEETAP